MQLKSYTDLEQSRKLAEILPLESADMRYQAHYDNKNNLKYIPKFISTIIPLKVDIHCWSLAALLGVLPNYEINNFGDGIQLAVNKEAFATEGDETLLDLVVNMIIYLHELKML